MTLMERLDLHAPVVAVTVLEDRAQVRREGRISLPVGRSLLRVASVAPVLSDKTLQVRVTTGPGQVTDARVVRVGRARLSEKPEAVRRREEQRRALHSQRRELLVQRAAVKQRLDGLAIVREQVLTEVAEQVAWGEADAAAWSADLEAVLGREAPLRASQVTSAFELERLDRALVDLDQVVASVVSPTTSVSAQCELEVVLDAAGEVTISVAYVTPGACWRPQHSAVLSDGRLSMETFACVWQYTGEDWLGARVSLSTQRSSLGSGPPLLGEDVLRARQKQEQVVVEARDQAIQTTGMGRASSEADGLPGIDDGGEVRTLTVAGAPPVRSDGRPHRLRLGSFTTEASVDRVVMPERTQAVIRRVRGTHTGEGPLLAGPVELIIDGGRVGRTTLLYVAAGAKFELGFGPDPGLRVHREAERVDHEPGTLSRWASTDHRVRVGLSNVGREPRTVEVTERVPVSEVEQVRIKMNAAGSSDGATPDSDGMVRWTVTLPAGGTAERVLAWRVEKKKDVAGL
jgi:uncharacterized protein (TIGR02231 family)